MIRNLTLENRYRILILLISLALFLPFNGLVHLFDWDEINFAESAREMIVTGNYSTVSINFMPFWEKPPLFIWMQVLSMKVFGINEFAARFPNAICGILSLLVIFEIGLRLKNYKFGLLWALAYGASLLPFLYFKSGIIDPWFNLFIFSAIYFAFSHISGRESGKKESFDMVFAGAILGLAVLTKGPVAILLFGLSIILYLLLEMKFKFLKWKDILIFSVVLALTGGAYHIYQLLLGNWQLVYDFFIYQVRLMKTEDAGHGGSIFYHPIVLFVGVFPSSLLAMEAFFKKDSNNNDYRKLMIVLFLVVLVIFSLVKTKIVHYSSLCYFPMSYLAAVSIYEIYLQNGKVSKLSQVLLAIIGFVFAISPAILQFLVTLPPEVLKGFIKDDFAIACINTPVHWSGFEFLIGVASLGILVSALFFLRGITQIVALFGSNLVFVCLFMVILVPKIEQYSQKPAIDFISEFKGKPVWVTTLGYKSYAPYFYSAKPKQACTDCNEDEYLLYGKTGCDVYFVIKSNDLKSITEKNPELVQVEQKGGFILLKRVDKLTSE